MSCNTEFIDFICSVLQPLGEVSSRKMMGDYVIYLNGKCVITACDNIAYIKKHPCIDCLMDGAEVGRAYPGAKEGYILSFDNPPFTRKIIALLWDVLPFPKKRK